MIKPNFNNAHMDMFQPRTPHKAFWRRWLVFYKRAVAIKSALDAWDVLQCSKAVAKCGLHQTVKVACSSV